MQDKDLIDFNTALKMVDNDKSLLQILISGFLTEAPFDKDFLMDLIQNKKDFTQAAHYVHRVKGAARQLAAQALAESGQHLEDILKGKAEGDPVYEAQQFCGLYSLTCEAMQKFSGGITG